jgi:hypothetical protein
MLAPFCIALGLSSTLWYIKAEQNVCTQCIVDELDSSLDSLDEEASATMLLQNQLYMAREEHIAKTSPLPKLLILIVSCHAHKSTWPELEQWGKRVHPGGSVVIMAGRPPNDTLPTLFEYDTSRGHLVVNASDAYDGLPVRMIAGFHSILQSPEHADITHVLKLDDTTILGSEPESTPTGIDAKKIELALSKNPGDYLTSEVGYRAYDCSKVPEKDMQWHFHNTDNTSYWYNRDQPCNGVFVYADGEFGYMLSRHALNVLTKAWPVESFDELYHTYVYEDMMVGQTLKKYSVTLYPTHVQGMPSWTRQTCPCNPAAPSALCDDHCANSNKRCCWQACGNYPGLCSPVRDI